jgi:SAM-dependent methyltransferase
MSPTGTTCPSCGERDVHVFYLAPDVPVNSVLLLASKEEAVTFPTGSIALGHCRACAFVYNTAFEPSRLEYSTRYEETQGHSPTFRAWHEALAARLVDRYDLRRKRIIEIGCGKGEFLRLLCELGDNHGVGFDPSYVPGREGVARRGRTEFVQDFYGEAYTKLTADFLCCKMTLEHVGPVGEMMRAVRRTVADQDAVIFFQVPDVLRILRERAFWDIYYEHCSYFSVGSLARVFRASGFDVLSVERDYADQYLMIEARPSRGRPSAPLPVEDDREAIASLVSGFAHAMEAQLSAYAEMLAADRRAGRRVVVWGSTSKGVAFLTSVRGAEHIEHVVDINPRRQGHFMAKTGQLIVGPDALRELRPDAVVVMNPIYRDEIERSLHELELHPEIRTT